MEWYLCILIVKFNIISKYKAKNRNNLFPTFCFLYFLCTFLPNAALTKRIPVTVRMFCICCPKGQPLVTGPY